MRVLLWQKRKLSWYEGDGWNWWSTRRYIRELLFPSDKSVKWWCHKMTFFVNRRSNYVYTSSHYLEEHTLQKCKPSGFEIARTVLMR